MNFFENLQEVTVEKVSVLSGWKIVCFFPRCTLWRKVCRPDKEKASRRRLNYRGENRRLSTTQPPARDVTRFGEEKLNETSFLLTLKGQSK